MSSLRREPRGRFAISFMSASRNSFLEKLGRRKPGDSPQRHHEKKSDLAFHAAGFFFDCLESPCHAGSVVENAEASLRVEQDDATVSVHAGLQIVDCLGGGPLG